jgi:hypothetical protein
MSKFEVYWIIKFRVQLLVDLNNIVLRKIYLRLEVVMILKRELLDSII